MFPKLLKNAKLEDVEKENPTLLASIRESAQTLINESMSASFVSKEKYTELESKIAELETTLSAVVIENTVLHAGIDAKQAVLAQSLIKEGKSEQEALSTISIASKSLESFTESAPPAAGSGSVSDSNSIETQAAAIEVVMKSNENITRASAIKLARRQYPELFVSPNLTNHNGKR